jgi:type I restriction enzyme, S subunit
MKPYPSYRDSVVEFINKIPVDWSSKRIGSVFQERNTKVSDKEFEPLSVTKNGIFRQLENVAKSDSHDDRKLVRENDFVINSRSDRKGSSGLSELDGSVSLINIVLVSNEEIFSKFSQYLFKSYEFVNEFYKHGRGIVDDLWSTKYSLMKNINIPIPPLPEQQQISNFLDKKTKQIDDLIEKTEQKIEFLKEKRISLINHCVTKGLDPNVEMKDSGVEWIGEIPKDWKTGSFKYVIEVLTDFTANGSFKSLADNVEYLDKGYSRLVRLTDLRSNLSNSGIYVSEESHKFLGKSELFGGEILVASVGHYTGISLKMSEGHGICTLGPNMYLIRNKIGNSDVDYLIYQINSNVVQDGFSLVITQTAQPKINKDNLKNIKVVIPSLPEQQQIVSHLDQETQKIDTLIEKENKRIDLLKEYRQSLISEVVTGKIDVRDEVLQ